MTTIQTKTAVTALAAFSLLGTLAGCASATTATSDDSSASTDSSSSAGTTSGSYKDGDYDESATYQSPGGTETLEVKLTLAGGVVTAVTVTGTPSGPDAVHYQGEFESGISKEVVGKSIDSLNVDRVGGSSLTSGGFNSAITKIKTDAAA